MAQTRIKRHIRIRKKVKGVDQMPRLSVYRSNKAIFAQAIDDQKGVTLLGMSDKSLKLKGTKVEKAKALGEAFSKAAKAKKILKVVFDRGGYRYHGRVKAFAEGARSGGLEF